MACLLKTFAFQYGRVQKGLFVLSKNKTITISNKTRNSSTTTCLFHTTFVSCVLTNRVTFRNSFPATFAGQSLL